MPRFSSTRAMGILAVLGGLFALLIGRVFYLETLERGRLLARANRQEHQTRPLAARRGSIWTSDHVLLAGVVQTNTLYVDPKFILEHYQSNLPEMDQAVARLAQAAGVDSFELSKMIGARTTARFVKVAQNLDEPTVRRIEALNIPGIGIAPAYARNYPLGSTAAHVLGACGTGGIGLDGLELKYQKLLAGADGIERMTKDARRDPIDVTTEDYRRAQHGQSLVLTIDSIIQTIAEDELADTCREFSAKHGEVVVIDPSNGDIVALANWPTFDPNHLNDSPAAVRRNSVLVDPYEPGSTNKPFIASPALMWNITQPAEMWRLPSGAYRTPYGRKIRDVHNYPRLNTWDALVKSSNITMSMLGERMGNARLNQAVRSFGFGVPTGVDLPGENPGKVNRLSKWTRYSTESIAQGYELMVTPLQIARAFCAIANGGHLVKPRIVKGVLDADGNVLLRAGVVDLNSLPRAIDAETAAVMRRILADVPYRGTARGNRSEVWNIAGKTGTSHISLGKLGYSDTRYNSSFIGMAPMEQPRLVVAFIIHDPDPNKATFGGTVAAPGACRILERSLGYLDVPPSPDLSLPPPEVAQNLWEYRTTDTTNRTYGAPKGMTVAANQ